MSFSRDDNAKTLCKLNEQNKSLGYMVNVPGNGSFPDYFKDPQIRLQKFGANLSENVVDINSELLGVNKQLDRDHFVKNTRDPNFNPTYIKYNFPHIREEITNQPRAMNPAWQIRGLETYNWDYPLFNPQTHTEMKFANNIDSRQSGKDEYKSRCNM
tara:strand:+ start:137 stop:607 length:471 start_codon:yes stop_codon:yes gene_type:complete